MICQTLNHVFCKTKNYIHFPSTGESKSAMHLGRHTACVTKEKTLPATRHQRTKRGGIWAYSKKKQKPKEKSLRNSLLVIEFACRKVNAKAIVY